MTRTELAGCAIIDLDQLLLLWRIGRRHYEFPGGQVEPGETPDATARREAREELGCDVTLLRYFGAIDFEVDAKPMRGHVYLAEILPGQTPTLREPETFSSLFYMPLREAHLYALAPNVRRFCEQYAQEHGTRR